MTLDLYKLYKQFYQRSHRSPDNEELSEMTRLAHDIAQKKYIGDLYNQMTPDTHQEILAIAVQLQELEFDYAPKTIFSKNLVSAINKNDYFTDVPHERKHKWQDIHNLEGYIYLFSSSSKPGQVKIGATYSDPFARSRRYASKFGYSVSVECYALVTNPFQAESHLANLFINFRVSGNTWGDSNEWYFIKVVDAKKRFKEFCKQR